MGWGGGRGGVARGLRVGERGAGKVARWGTPAAGGELKNAQWTVWYVRYTVY